MPHLSRVLFWQRPDGVSITHLHSADMLQGETEDEFIERYVKRLKHDDLLKDCEVTVVAREKLPETSEHQDCWTIGEKEVEVDSRKLQAKMERKSDEVKNGVI